MFRVTLQVSKLQITPVNLPLRNVKNDGFNTNKIKIYIAHLRQHFHNSKCLVFQEKI